MDIEKINMYFTDPTKTFSDNLCTLEQALKDMISEANHEIILVSYSISSFSDDFFLEERIKDRIKKGVKLKIFGEEQLQVNKLFTRYKLSNSDVEGWYWDKNSRGLFHIKSIIVDRKHVGKIYLGSANLSKNAMKYSAELGVLTESKELCFRLYKYLDHLKAEGKLKKLS
jgi:phosphatidylserine/phosphatidylglycerophosphate/cardiolipin synthase-like enzyme